MADRRQTPDILGAVLGGDAPKDASTPVRQHDSTPARRQTSKPAKPKTSKPASQKATTPAEPEAKPTKATFYLSGETLDAMEDALYQLRKLAGQDRSRVTKSALVEAALVAALRDLEAKGPASQLASKLVES